MSKSDMIYDDWKFVAPPKKETTQHDRFQMCFTLEVSQLMEVRMVNSTLWIEHVLKHALVGLPKHIHCQELTVRRDKMKDLLVFA